MVTGGAGYIGAHIVKSLKESGHGVVAFDDLSTGEARKVPSDVPLVEASVLDAVAVEKAIRENDVTGVVHMAAKKAVGESVERPLYYYRENVDGLLSPARGDGGHRRQEDGLQLVSCNLRHARQR